VSTADKTTSRVSQQSGKSVPTSTNSLPNAAKPQVNATLTNSPEKPVPNTDSPHETFSETVPRLRRDCSETNGRPLEDSISKIRPEDMLEQETRQRVRSERMPEPLLTLREAADYLRLTPAALDTQRHLGDKPGALGVRVGRKILYRQSDINQYLDELLAEIQISQHR
jgi:hypothetical protein